MTLSYILPYILHEKFDEFDSLYRNYMHLVAKVVLYCSPYSTCDTVGKLQVLVEGYLHGFKNLYPTKPLRLKHHFLLHLLMQILRFGPLRNQWLFRFESKNNSFKNFKTHNFINLPYSLTKYHQLASCYSLLGSDGGHLENYLYSGDIVKEGNTVKFSDLNLHLLAEFMGKLSANQDGMVYDTNEIIVHGLKYRPGACLLIDWEDNTSNSFNVQSNDTCAIFVLKELKNKWPLPLYEIGGHSLFVTDSCHFGQGFF